MTDVVKEALRMIADPHLAGLDWPAVCEQQRLDEGEEVSGEDFCCVMYSNWIYARLARLILDGDETALREFIEKADPRRLVRDRKEP